MLACNNPPNNRSHRYHDPGGSGPGVLLRSFSRHTNAFRSETIYPPDVGKFRWGRKGEGKLNEQQFTPSRAFVNVFVALPVFKAPHLAEILSSPQRGAFPLNLLIPFGK